jgi:hypothetical protein
MMLEISSFANPGVIENERLVIKVLSDLDIGSYAVLSSAVSDEKAPTSGRKAAYWFPDQAVKSGDLIVLYTKSGKNSKKDISNGHTAHFFYWGYKEPMWGSLRTAVILRVAEWTHRVNEVV